MLYRSCSIESVIGKVVRDTKVQDASLLGDMVEWIPEALEQLQCQQQLYRDFQDTQITFHRGSLPCGLVHIDAVEYCGQRIGRGNGVKNIRTGLPIAPQTTPTLFVSVPYKEDLPTGNPQYLSTLVPAGSMDVSKVWYDIEMGTILTSFADGWVRLHFSRTAVDEQGFPLIPDNANFKEAVYYYVRAKMIGTGYNDIAFKEETCMARFEMYGARAIAEITYPSLDEMEHRVNTLVRFIPPANYFENYFRVDSPERPYIPL